MPIPRSSHTLIPIATCLLGATICSAQWPDRKAIGPGGESAVTTDGKGNVYVTVHQPCKLYASHDGGASFVEKKEFEDAFCDLDVLAWPNGDVNVSFIKAGISGMASYFSTNNGATFTRGSGVDGKLDREWLAPNLDNGELYMDYSNGFIGGPPSVGVFLAASTDHGKTFKQRSRVDREPSSDHPVDPYLTTATDGRIYAMWSTTKDGNTIDRFDYSYSIDGGRSFTGHQTIGELHKTLGDTQERWILGSISAFGKNRLVAIYPDYTTMTVDGQALKPLLLYYRVSSDSGQTFSEPKTVLSQSEIEANIRTVLASKKANGPAVNYLQTLPWTCADPFGRIYLAFQDNRDGQGSYNGQTLDKWHVRMTTMETFDGGFGESERVSEDVVCMRPPLDFLSCAADKHRIYITWTETLGSTTWSFSGKTYIARKILHAPADKG